MKKVININFQGRIIPIEEDAYENLKKYVESLRQYFANEEGKEEIINDIENRIAELFSEKLKTGALPFITEESVASIIASIGRPEDFDGNNIEFDAKSAAASNAKSSQTYGGFEPRGSWFRNQNDKILGGVCSGLASYLRIDATIIRVLFVLFSLGAFGAGFLIYIILWAVLPSKSQEGFVARRLYRDADQKVFGGVCSGIAKYFNIVVWIPRLIFLLPILLSVFKNVIHIFYFPVIFSFSGTLILTYLILWAVIPKALTASEKMEMKGEKIDLASIKNKVQDEIQEVKKNITDNAEKWRQDFSGKASELKNEAKESARRFAVETGPTIRKNSNRFGRSILTIIKVFFFFIISVTAFGLLMAVVSLVVAGTALMPLKDFIANGSLVQIYAWATLILFFIVPVVALIQWLIRRIVGIKLRNQYISYTLGILWAAGWVSIVLLIAAISKEFKRSGQVSSDVVIQQPSTGKMKIEFKDPEGRYYPLDLNLNNFDNDNDEKHQDDLRLSIGEDSLLIGNISIRLVKSNDDIFHITTIKRARSSSPREAEQIAESIPFFISQVDSIIYVPIAFPITKQNKFRNQQVRIQIEVPVGKEVFINDRAENLHWFSMEGNERGLTFSLDNESGYNYFWRSGVWYIMTERGIEKKFKDEENIDEDDRDERKSRKKKLRDRADSIEMKIEKEIDEHLKSNTQTDANTGDESEEPTSWKGKRVLFSAIDLLKIAK